MAIKLKFRQRKPKKTNWHTVQLDFSPEFQEVINRAAASRGISTPEFIRWALRVELEAQKKQRRIQESQKKFERKQKRDK